jgi:uncharacterized DUF497 family protein
MLTFDRAKDAANIAKHGVSLALASRMEILAWRLDDRRDYGERRYIAYGLIDGGRYCLVFADRDGEVRAISLRRAHSKEFDRHVPRT